MLPAEQLKKIKEQLLKQLENWPEEQREGAKKEIEAMNDKELIEFLKKNNLIKESDSQAEQCIFCQIIKGNIPSHKIAETQDAIAILEINPISKGHILILPKNHVQEPYESITKFAEKIAKKVSEKFSPKDVQIITGGMFGHLSINLLPVYDNETIESPRKKASEEELKKLQKELTKEEPKPGPKEPEKEPEKPLTPEEKKKLEEEYIKALPKAPRRQP